MSKTRIAVIGAGAIGCAVAYYNAKEGADVTLIDAGDIANYTSSRCDGNVLVGDKEPGYDASLTARSQDLLDDLRDELDYDFEWERRGSMLLMENQLEMQMGDVLCKQLQDTGIRCHMMDQKELREREPYVASDIPGGMWIDQDGCLYPMGLCYGLADGLKKRGGKLSLHNPVTGIDQKNGGFVVHTVNGDIEADVVVNCGGVKAPEIGQMVGLSIPIQARQGQILVSEQSFKVAKQKVMEFGYMMAKFQNEGEYKRPVTPDMEKYGVALVYEPTGGNNFLLGSSRYFSEDLHAEIDVMRAIAERGIRFFPVMKDIKVVRCYAGVRPFTPDHMPIISETEIPGYYIAAGHEGDGIGMSAVTGLLVSQMIAGKKTEFDMERLSFKRFCK